MFQIRSDMSSKVNNIIMVCKDELYKGDASDIIIGLKTMPTGLGKEEMVQHMHFILETSRDILTMCEQGRRATMNKIILQERKLEDLRNEHVNIEDDSGIIDRIMGQVGCYTDCRMLKASIRRRKNLNKMLSEDEVTTLSLEKYNLEEIEKKVEAAKVVISWAKKQLKDESSVLEIE